MNQEVFFMKWIQRLLIVMLAVACCVGCAQTTTQTSSEAIKTNLEQIDQTTWQYNKDDDVYYQIGVSYCENPTDEDLQTLSVFIPGAYVDATENEDGTYTLEIKKDAKVEGYTAETAPIVMPVNTPGYSSQSALTAYTNEASTYTKAGLIYVVAGCRGKESGAPSGVADLKAAIRYLRYNQGNIAGDTESIFVFGHSGGGAQSAILGASGDSELYDAYLKEIGAVQGVSDAVAGVMSWCPITNLDTANEAYEWNLGSSRSDLSEEEQTLSDTLATAYAQYINELGLKDEDGNVLSLSESESGIYQSGSYYDEVKETIEESLNTFLQNTEFPYDSSADSMEQPGMGGGMPGGEMPSGEMPSGEKQDGEMPFGKMPSGNMPSGRMGMSQNQGESQTYESVQDYIDALNEDHTWIQYDAETNTATITSVEDFVAAMKSASKEVGAFDNEDATQTENVLFGTDGQGAHFDMTLMEALGVSNDETDAQGNDVETRVNMYNPMYYLCDYYDGYQTSTTAKYWRIRSGINQGDTALTTEMNLALALEQAKDTDVDFETVWGQGHTQAESEGNATENFISWIQSCTQS